MPVPENREEQELAALVDDSPTIDGLFSITYEELRRFASYARRRNASITLSSTGLVHEAWLKLKDSPRFASVSTSQFKAVAAKAMRRILIDEVRRRNARKRGGGEAHMSLDGAGQQVVSCPDELLDLDAALEELERVSPRQARMIEFRFFAGLDVSETAKLLGVSESVIERDWRAAKAWLAGQIRPHSRIPTKG